MSAPPAALLAAVNSTLRGREGTKSASDGELTIRCIEPGHDDRNPSAGWNTSGGFGRCHSCGASWSTRRAAELLGLEPPAGGNGSRLEKSWEIRDRRGELQAVHVRYPGPDGSKAFSWKLPNGTKGLGGRPLKSLPLYLSEKIDSYDAALPVFLTEGEKDADAAAVLGLQVVATATGSSSCPSSEVGGELAGFRVVLWPDHDTVGRTHMGKVSEQLAAAGVDVAGTVDTSALWRGAPEEGQGAADLRALPQGWPPLLESADAEPKKQPHYLPQKTGATAQPPASNRPEVTQRPVAVAPSLAYADDILKRFEADLAGRGVVGEVRTGKILYLAITSRVTEDPVSAAVKGHSSSGKSSLTDRVVEFFPPEAVVKLTSASSRALIYTDSEFKHRTIYIREATGLRETDEESSFAYLVRTLLSEGRIDHEATIRGKDGKFTTQKVCKEGPTNLVFTTTRTRVHAENETRIFSLNTDDSPDQTRRVLLALADERARSVDLEEWRQLQSWLQTADHRVTIPYARELAELVPPAAVRLRRDFKAVLSLIRSHAILHQKTRDRDEDGRIIAQVDDYAAVHEMIVEVVSEGVGSTVSEVVRETVRAVSELGGHDQQGVQALAVARHLGIDKSNAGRRIRRAADEGYVRNLEDRRGKAGRWVLGDPLPEQVDLLPHPCNLAATGETLPVSGDSGSGCAVAPYCEGVKGAGCQACERLGAPCSKHYETEASAP